MMSLLLQWPLFHPMSENKDDQGGADYGFGF
jgi:hypothetical protein